MRAADYRPGLPAGEAGAELGAPHIALIVVRFLCRVGAMISSSPRPLRYPVRTDRFGRGLGEDLANAVALSARGLTFWVGANFTDHRTGADRCQVELGGDRGEQVAAREHPWLRGSVHDQCGACATSPQRPPGPSHEADHSSPPRFRMRLSRMPSATVRPGVERHRSTRLCRARSSSGLAVSVQSRRIAGRLSGFTAAPFVPLRMALENVMPQRPALSVPRPIASGRNISG